ncbi:hypothetical protein GCM10009069_09280 [Algimonas arctica]|uniref:Uncharacterized protein n=1 Tax=Algimonas arctica TaxID=1479486 RepID=A0A8J3G1V5_9PROT|nr:hypothetical protein [Algimonas arctica]GHA88469.1 hypothetical protein GCM10009069_09280 [Algimonas arctica]
MTDNPFAAVAVRTLFFSSCFFITSCAPETSDSPTDAFFDNLTSLCEGTFTGQVISDQAADADWIGQTLVVGPVTCARDVVRMPLAVGEDRSRTWVVSRDSDALEFRHEHTEPDGSPSAVTEYGGFSRDGGTATLQAFPADDLTKVNFTENGIAVSNANVWTFEMSDGMLTYTLARPATEDNVARDFRAQFDVTP